MKTRTLILSFLIFAACTGKTESPAGTSTAAATNVPKSSMSKDAIPENLQSCSTTSEKPCEVSTPAPASH